MRQSRPEVSVILPARNGGVHLKSAVDSIRGQTLQNLELILVDDHSDDAAFDQLDTSDQRLQVLNNPGRGVVSAFNHGLRHARGRYVARMDADDISLPGRLEAQVDYLERHTDVGIAGACVEIFSGDGIDQGMRIYQDWLNSVRAPDQVRKQMFIESPIPNPTAMFRREVIEQLGGYRDIDWPEDYDLYLRADQAGIRMGKPVEVLLRWRDHRQRLTHTDKRYARVNFQRAKANFLANGRLPDVPFLIWGAGSTGRQMHDLLLGEGREARGFIEVHPRRIGMQKRGKPVFDMHDPDTWPDGFIVVAVGFRGARAEISEFLCNMGRREGEEFLFAA